MRLSPNYGSYWFALAHEILLSCLALTLAFLSAPSSLPFLLCIYTEVMRVTNILWVTHGIRCCPRLAMTNGRGGTGWAGRPRGKGLLTFPWRRTQRNLEPRVRRRLWEPTWAWCAGDGTGAKWEIEVPVESPRPTDTCRQMMDRFWASNGQNGDRILNTWSC